MNSVEDELDGFTKVCSIKEIEENVGKRFIINNTDIAVFFVNNEVHVIENICPHQHSALIYDGFIEGEFVVCPAHGWKFNLKTGKTPTGSRGLETYVTKVVNGYVYAKVVEKKFSW